MTDQLENRDSAVILVCPLSAVLCVHFCRPAKLQGNDADLWIPLYKTTDKHNIDFVEIERLMQVNRIAHNVTSIEYLRECGLSVEYKVTFNKYIKA